MQVKLKLSKNEYKGLLTIVSMAMDSMGEPNDMLSFLEWDALRELSLELLKRMPDMKEKNNVTLKTEAMMVLIRKACLIMLPPYENALFLNIMKGADLQWRKRMTELKSNMQMIGGVEW